MTATLRDPTTADTGKIRVGRRGNIAHVTLSRPHKRNSLTATMWGSLEKAITELGRSDTLHAIVLTGEGGAFSAGADLSEVHAATESRGRQPRCTAMRSCEHWPRWHRRPCRRWPF